MIPIHVSLNYYKRRDIQEEIIANSKDREVVAKFNDNFGKRPDVLRHPSDILELAKQGATSFHASEELWRNALQLNTSLRRHDLDSLRIGWDLVLDIDCGFFEYSKIAADLVIKALKFYNVSSISCKFSGNRGFHIGVPFEAFPEKIRNEETKNLFPDAPRKIALYIKDMIKKPLGEKIMEFENNDFNAVIKKTGKKMAELTYYDGETRILNAEPFLDIDSLLISPRHLYRMPYSLHEKSGLASTPLNPEKVLLFGKELAIPKNVRISKHGFLYKGDIESHEARRLLMEALDFSIKRDASNLKSEKKIDMPEKALPEELFPPCIRLILNGLEDGRKRALFILLNYLTSIGWDYEMIEKKLIEWNSKNKESLREAYLIGQLRYHKQARKIVLPPNCPKRENNLVLFNQQNYYSDLRICCPDSLCAKIKNPAQYTTRKSWLMSKYPKDKAEIGSDAKQN
ncbi:MAG: DNA primase small subunit domain-containing protein [Nanoarchaeota archaeon]